MRARKIGEGGFTEADIYALDEIVARKDPAAVCPRCDGDLYFVDRGSGYAIWCVNPSCRLGNVTRGI